MTENEKLDLILAGMQDMKAGMQDMKAGMQDMKAEMQDMKAEMQDMKNDVREIRQKVNRLEVAQADIKRELFRIDRKISDTYNLALDAWGQGVENKEWLEGATLKM